MAYNHHIITSNSVNIVNKFGFLFSPLQILSTTIPIYLNHPTQLQVFSFILELIQVNDLQ